jgi:heterodisulfide reductase subunit C
MPPPEIPRALLESRVTELVDSEFIWACTLCGRCTLECPEGLDMDRIMRVVRGQGVREDKVPKRLKEGLDKIRETGNSIGVDAEEFVDTLQWLAEEAAEEIEGVDGQPEIPIDEEGAEFLYLPNPREYTSTPHMFSVYWKFFLATAADWTYASDVCD